MFFRLASCGDDIRAVGAQLQINSGINIKATRRLKTDLLFIKHNCFPKCFFINPSKKASESKSDTQALYIVTKHHVNIEVWV